MTPVEKGWRAALKLFGIFGVLHLVLFLAALVYEPLSITVMLSGLLTLPAALIAAGVTSAFLPREARGSFWLSVLIGMFALAAVWLSTCGGALSLNGGL